LYEWYEDGANNRSILETLQSGKQFIFNDDGTFEADSVSTDELNGTLYTSKRDGTAYERIQEALDVADSASGWVRVVIDDAPDDLTSTAADVDEGYLLSQSVEVGDYTIVENQSYVFLESGADDNLLRNKEATAGGRNDHIVIRGDGTWDGNASNQTTFNRDNADSVKNIGLRFFKVDWLRLESYTTRNTNGWGNKIEDGKWLFCEGLAIDQNASTPNQDGVHLIGPWDGAYIDNVQGASGDDLIAVNCDDPDGFNEGSGGYIANISVTNAIGENDYGVVRIWGSETTNYQARNISVSDVIGFAGAGQAVRVGFRDQAAGSLFNVDVDGVSARGSKVSVAIEADSADINISGVSNYGGGDAITVYDGVSVDGLYCDDILQEATNKPLLGVGDNAVVDNLDLSDSRQKGDQDVISSGSGATVNGTVSDIEAPEATGQLFEVSGDVRFGKPIPPVDVTTLPAVEGSEAYHNGAGTNGPAYSDGLDWISAVDGTTL